MIQIILRVSIYFFSFNMFNAKGQYSKKGQCFKIFISFLKIFLIFQIVLRGVTFMKKLENHSNFVHKKALNITHFDKT